VEAILIYFDLQVMISPIGFHASGGKSKEIKGCRSRNEVVEASFEVVVIVEESSAGAACEFSHHVFIRGHGGLAVLIHEVCRHGRAPTSFKSVQFRGVEAARIDGVDDHIGLRRHVQDLRFEGHGFSIGSEKTGGYKNNNALSWKRAHFTHNEFQEVEVSTKILLSHKHSTARG
jgi:hypothetical protein